MFYNGAVLKQAVIIVSSRRLVRALNRLGLTSNKTFTVRPSDAVPEELLADYWRGIFDGDGSITSSGLLGIKWQMSLVGNKFIVEDFRDFIACFVNTNANVRPTGNVFRIVYNGRMVTRAMAQVLYESATIYLGEKTYDERMHGSPFFHATNIPNAPATNLVQIGIGGWTGPRQAMKVARERKATVITIEDIEHFGDSRE